MGNGVLMMAAITKKDRDWLYGRASQLSEEAMRNDEFADDAAREGLEKIAADHRNLAQSGRDLAKRCREWADSWSATQ